MARTPGNTRKHVRNVVLVLGDQLDRESSALDHFDRQRDRILIVESAAEARHVWSHKARIAMFFTAMRHHAAWLREQGYTVDYLRTGLPLATAVHQYLGKQNAEKLVVTEPGDWRVLQELKSLSGSAAVSVEIRPDRHFLASISEFEDWARGRRELRMEYFYRSMRLKTGILMRGTEPTGGRWNYDAENRKSFGLSGPGSVPLRKRFAPDEITRDVIKHVEKAFPDHPGSLAAFDWPVSCEQALEALADFIDNRLASFGSFQDAMWTKQPFLYHSTLSAALNLKLLNPREVIDAALQAKNVPLAALEGFVRQVLGWREFIRGVYWLEMPKLAGSNYFGHKRDLPRWYWSGQTHMACMAAAISQTLEFSYAHHIQRLMLTGMFGVLAEIAPKQVSDWYLAVYVDAVEWVEHPNVLGMALYANGGRFTSKPYIASGAYVSRMSNYCAGCRYDPKQKTGERACPLTTLYWRFLDRHEREFAASPRTSLMVRNITRMSRTERTAVREWGNRLLERIDLV